MLDSVADLAASMRSGGLSGGAVVGGIPSSSQAPSPTIVQMTNIVRDDLDIELLARKVAEYVRRRA